MVEISLYVIIYSNTLPHMKAFRPRSVDAARTILIHGAEFSTSNEGCLRFELVTYSYVDSDTMSRNKLNLKTLEYVMYFNT